MTDKLKAEYIMYKLLGIRKDIFLTAEDILMKCESSSELDWWYRKLCGEKMK